MSTSGFMRERAEVASMGPGEEGKQGNMGRGWKLGKELQLRERVRERVRGQLGALTHLGFPESF